ncbi:penicillin-binding protein activator [Shewanella sp. C32]|uniref:Penicillin-binding protein activator n=1 Tax=Shewanella electrica TaxID=515560 RepID=A0ABT2FR18_9GAMM|nr:penicillin-binding protein activator [Shewanella electrica]MCS4557659.1 penicillin-binding protein activator [Shewanella electrica]
MLKRQNSIKFVLAVSLMAALWGCGTQPRSASQAPQPLSSTALQSSQQSPTFYLDAAAKATDAETRQRYLLQAAQAYINTNQLKAASEILDALRGSLVNVPELQAQHRYLQALVLEQKGMLADALYQLKYVSSWPLADWQWRDYYQLRASLYAKTKRPAEQVRELCQLSQYLSSDENTELNRQIWSLLNGLQEETLEYYIQQGGEATYLGWLKLAYLAKHYAVDPSSLVSQLGRWQSANPGHPAAMQLPQDLQGALSTKPYHPQKIAVLLPLTGERAKVAEPLKNGITANYLDDPDSNVELQFYDTATGAAAAYQAALTAGADFVIGPLLQNSVQQVIEFKATHNSQPNAAPLPPQLFLNNADVLSNNQDDFYFALSPVQEAIDAVQRMYQDGIEQPLLLASDDAIGHRMAESFNLNWQQLTNKPAEIHYFTNDKMRQTVQDSLGVTDSEARIDAVKKLLGTHVKADFRSRSDIDAIYMICSAHDLTLLKSFIDVNFSVFAEPAKLYTSSRARQDDSRQIVQELNKITISDIPWLMESNGSSNLASLWPSWGNPQKRLYAMGFDALSLVNKLAQMRAFPGYQLSGHTGLLSVSKDGVINRQLKWGQYNHGVLRSN